MIRQMRNSFPQITHAVVILLLAFVAVGLFMSAASAHSGGYDKYGCHTNSATGEYHCKDGVKREKPKTDKSCMNDLPKCIGCGCRGGPEYRDKNDNCVGYLELASKCGTPPEQNCTRENHPNKNLNRDCVLGITQSENNAENNEDTTKS